MTKPKTWHAYPPELDAFLKPCGPCGMCGGPDARHRMVEAITERVHGGSPVTWVADDFEMSPEAIEYIADLQESWRA